MKQVASYEGVHCVQSHSARGAWIETDIVNWFIDMRRSHSARGAWIETLKAQEQIQRTKSHSARGAWIETEEIKPAHCSSKVALREGCVD